MCWVMCRAGHRMAYSGRCLLDFSDPDAARNETGPTRPPPAKKNDTATFISTLSVEGCACLCASSQRIARMRKRSIDRENVDGSVETWEPPSFKIVWGPVSEERAVRFGAISGRISLDACLHSQTFETTARILVKLNVCTGIYAVLACPHR